MATISPSNCQTLCDNIAKSLVDIESAFITNHGSNSPTTSTITAGQNGGSNSLRAHIASLNDTDQEAALAPSAKSVAANVIASLTVSPNQFYALYGPLMNALDLHTGGLNAFLVANSVMVNSEFAAAFNYAANNAPSLGLRGLVFTPIAPANVFPNATQTLASIAVTGSSAGTFSAGTNLDLTKYAPAQLYLKNTGVSGTTGTATSFTITYTNASGTAGQSATQALGGALAAGATLAISGAVGEAVSNIVVNSGGASGDAIAVVIIPARSVAY